MMDLTSWLAISLHVCEPAVVFTMLYEMHNRTLWDQHISEYRMAGLLNKAMMATADAAVARRTLPPSESSLETSLAT